MGNKTYTNSRFWGGRGGGEGGRGGKGEGGRGEGERGIHLVSKVILAPHFAMLRFFHTPSLNNMLHSLEILQANSVFNFTYPTFIVSFSGCVGGRAKLKQWCI